MICELCYSIRKEGRRCTFLMGMQLPGIRQTDSNLFDIYGRVALTGKPERFSGVSFR